MFFNIWDLLADAFDGVWFLFMKLDEFYNIASISAVLVFLVAVYRFILVPVLGGKVDMGSDKVKRAPSQKALEDKKS